MRTNHLILALVLIPALGSAQTTPTEIAAASDILIRIEALQQRIAPEETARDITERTDQKRFELMEHAGQVWDAEMQDLSDHIGRNPEVGWAEFEAVDTLVKVLLSKGFVVETGVADLETAFVATWVSPAGSDGAVLGLIGEYDALRDIDGPFHGDQHNAQTPVAICGP